MVSSDGLVYSKPRYVDGKLGSKRLVSGRILRQFYSVDGYKKVELNGIGYPVHRLVALAFIENERQAPEVNHKDRCRDNNSVDNLEWVTLQENQSDSWSKGRVGNMKGRFGFLHNKSNPIVQIKDGERVGIFGSIKEAARELGVADCVIGQAIKRNAPISKKSHKLYGFYFEKI